LKKPAKSIINGTLAAVVTGLLVYIMMAFWFSKQATEAVLLADTSVILEISLFKPLVVAGILGATLSSALSTLVGAPRTLAALAAHRIIPAYSFLVKKAPNNEPRNAVIVSSVLSLAVLMAGNLDLLAGLLTMFFLIIYGTINLVFLIELVSGLTSFRPRIRLSIAVPGMGFFGCVLAMLLINKLFTVIALTIVLLIYLLLVKKHLVSPWGDVRGGIFTAIAEWAAQKAMLMPYHPRLWKPSVLVPVERSEDFRGIARLVRNIIFPSGRLYCLSVNNGTKTAVQNALHIDEVLEPLKEENIFIHKIIIKGDNFEYGLDIAIQTMLSTFLPPNAILLTISNDPEKQQKLTGIMRETGSTGWEYWPCTSTRNLDSVRKRKLIYG